MSGRMPWILGNHLSDKLKLDLGNLLHNFKWLVLKTQEELDGPLRVHFRTGKGMGNWKSCQRPGRSSAGFRTVKEISIYLNWNFNLPVSDSKEISIYLYRTVKKFNLPVSDSKEILIYLLGQYEI